MYKHKCKVKEQTAFVKEAIESALEPVQQKMLEIQQDILNRPQTVNNHLVINAFGSEDLSNLQNKSEFLDQCIRRRIKGHLELCKQMFLNLPENINVKPCKHPHLFMVYDGETWMRKDRYDIADTMSNTAGQLMKEHFESHENRLKKVMSQSLFEDVCDYLDKVERHDFATQSKLRDELCGIIEKVWNEVSSGMIHI